MDFFLMFLDAPPRHESPGWKIHGPPPGKTVYTHAIRTKAGILLISEHKKSTHHTKEVVP
jgi:hypothetical protein